MNKPIYVGFCILDISKTLMYDFHYGFIKPKYGKKAKLLFTDTDSLCYEIQTKNVYEDVYNDKDLFALSEINYPRFEKYKDNINKKVIGKFKLEHANDLIDEFIGLRSKMYSLQFEDRKTEKKAKRIAKSAIKKDLKHKHYSDILQSGKKMCSNVKVIRSLKHRVFTIQVNKVSLSAFDDKRFLKKDGIKSFPYSHYKTLK